jgi:uncharacterized protein (DUF433 family)
VLRRDPLARAGARSVCCAELEHGETFRRLGRSQPNLTGLPFAKTRIPPRDAPAYPINEAAHYLRVAPATLRSWVVGSPYPTSKGVGHFKQLIRRADPAARILSFNNLVEAHVLRALRTGHGLELKAVRFAIAYVQEKLGIERLLLDRKLLSDGKNVLLEKYGELLNLSNSGQIAMRVVFEAHLQRVEWDNSALPQRLYPFVRHDVNSGPRHIAIDPSVGFGRPIIRSCGVSTKVIVDRLDAGEPIADLAADYGLKPDEVEEAAVYERAA